MSFLTRIFFGILMLQSIYCAVQAQDADADIEWFESFFQDKSLTWAETTLAQTQASVQDAIETNDGAAHAKALMEMGLIHLVRTRNDERAMDFFVQALIIEDSLALHKEQIFTYLAMAKLVEGVGDYEKSAQFLEQALAIEQALKNIKVEVLVLNELGRINAARGRADEARVNFETILKYKEELDDAAAEANALFNLAHLDQQEGKYEQALKGHKQALAIRRSLGDRQQESLSLSDIGELYSVMKNTERALANHVAALEIRQSLKDTKGLAVSYNNIGVLYFQTKNYQRAMANLELGLAAARETQNQSQIARSYDYMSQCFEASHEYKKALEYKSLYLAINDFIQRERTEQKLLETQNRYELDKKESEIDKLEQERKQKQKELDNQRKFRNVLIVVVVLVITVALLVYYLYVLKKRSNQELTLINEKVQDQNVQLQDLNATKDKFFSIISHDLKGPLNSLTSFSGLLINHTESLSKEDIQMLAKDLDKSVKNLFALLENLLEWSRSQTGNIEFTPKPFDLGALLEENKELLKAQAQAKKINLVNENKEALTVTAHQNSINTVVRNLISNAIKFTPEGGLIIVGMKRRDREVEVSVADNGVGMSPQVVEKLFRIDTKISTKGTADEKGTGLGLILCKDFIEKNGGQISVQSEVGKGTVFYFTLPLPH